MLPLVVDYRDKRKKINKWGRIALIGAAASTFVSAASQYFELQKGKADAQDALIRANTLLTQVERALTPVKNLNVSACIEIPLSSPDLIDVATRLKQYVDGDRPITNGDYLNQSKKALIVRNVSSIVENTPPNAEVYRALSDVTIGVSFLLSSNALTEIAKQFVDPATAPQGDLKISFLSDNEKTKNQYFYKNGRLFMIIQDVPSDPKYWISSGQIISIVDLQNANLVVDLENFSVSGNVEKLGRIRSAFILRKLTFGMTDGRHFEIAESAFLVSHNNRNEPLFLYRFPSSVEQFPKPAMVGLTCDELLG